MNVNAPPRPEGGRRRAPSHARRLQERLKKVKLFCDVDGV
jgi:hypothetical protein